MNYQVWESTDNSDEFETMRKVQKRMIMIAASFRLSWDWKSIIGMRDISWRDDGTPLNMGCRVNKHDTFHRSILEIKCPLVFTKFIYAVSWRKHAYTRRLLFIPSTTEPFFFFITRTCRHQSKIFPTNSKGNCRRRRSLVLPSHKMFHRPFITGINWIWQIGIPSKWTTT